MCRKRQAVFPLFLLSDGRSGGSEQFSVFRSHRWLADYCEGWFLSAQRNPSVCVCFLVHFWLKMPLENLEEEGLPKNPDLRIAQLKFLLTMDGHRQDAKVKTELMDAIKANSELAFHCTVWLETAVSVVWSLCTCCILALMYAYMFCIRYIFLMNVDGIT